MSRGKKGLAAIAIAILSLPVSGKSGPNDLPAQEMDLNGAIQLALQNSLGAKIERLQVDVEQSRLDAQRGEFEPAFKTSALYESILNIQNTRDFVATQSGTVDRGNRTFSEENWRFNTGFEGKTALGTKYELNLELNRLKNTLNIQIPPSLFYPEYESFFGLRITQPLLKDFGPAAQLAGVRVARTDKKISELAWRLKVEKLVSDVSKNYYDLLFARQDLAIKQENLEAAQTLEGQNRKRVDQGVGSDLDVRQAAVASAVREEELLAAKQFLRERMNLLQRDLITDYNPGTPLEIRPTGKLSAHGIDLDEDALMRSALERRPEYLQAQQQLVKQDIKIRYAKNQTYPRVDLVGSLGANGLADDTDSAIGDTVAGYYPEWSVGVAVTVPIGNLGPRSQLRQVRFEKQQLLLNIKQLEIDLGIQIDTATSRVQTSRERVGVTQKAVDAAASTLEAEQRRLEEGVGVSLQVLESQRDLALARSRHLAATADLCKAITDLRLVSGRLLEDMGIELELPEPAKREPKIFGLKK